MRILLGVLFWGGGGEKIDGEKIVAAGVKLGAMPRHDLPRQTGHRLTVSVPTRPGLIRGGRGSKNRSEKILEGRRAHYLAMGRFERKRKRR